MEYTPIYKVILIDIEKHHSNIFQKLLKYYSNIIQLLVKHYSNII